jgi:hypothetical protein
MVRYYAKFTQRLSVLDQHNLGISRSAAAQVPVNEFHWIIFTSGQDLIDLREDTGGRKTLQAHTVKAWPLRSNNGRLDRWDGHAAATT